MAMRVVVLDDYQRVAQGYASWDDLGPAVQVEFVPDHLSGEALLSVLAGAAAVVAMRERTPFPATVFEALPELRLLVTTGMGNASIDLAAAHAHGVTVCGTGGIEGAAAELTWGLILALLRHIPAEDALIRQGGWQSTVGSDLAGRTLGLVGLGRLGQRVARVGLAFEMRVQAWSANLDPALARSLGIEPVTKGELFDTSDVVSVHLKLSERSVGTIGEPELRAMRRTAYLVNTSRGPLVDEAALVRALDEGWIAGAGLDVYDAEPLPVDHPLRTAPNTVLAPHVGYVTDGAYRVFYGEAVEDIAAWRAEQPVRVLTG
jgi:phosphoglycerate dehydrogenase-like enzyme